MSATATREAATREAVGPDHPDVDRDGETRQIVYVVGLFSAVALIVACVALGLSTRGHPAVVTVGPSGAPAHDLFIAEHDYTLTASAATVSAGRVTVRIANFGPHSHELLAFRTDLPEAALPVGADGRVNEDDPTITKVLDTNTDLTPATQRTLTLNLAPGRYVFICNLLNHYRLGMHYVINVTR